jgi:hypothetical protein
MRVMGGVELLVTEGANGSERRGVSDEMRNAVGNPGFEIPWIKSQIASDRGKLAGEVIAIVEWCHCKGLVQVLLPGRS